MSTKAIKHIGTLGFPWQTSDPFLFCVHHEDFFPEGNEDMGPDVSLAGRNLGNDFVVKDGFRMYHGRKVPGFPAHPHRGFETVTIARRGYVDHSDSLGAAGRFGEGDVQWMTAGKGVQHAEMFPLVYSDQENPFEIFQIWLNLPSHKKSAEPHFAMLWSDTIPVIEETDTEGKKSFVTIVAGNYRNTTAPAPAPDSWAADPKNEVAIWTIKMEAGAQLDLPAAGKDINRTLYFYKGNVVSIEDREISPQKAIEVHADQPLTLYNGDKDGYFLLLQGRPINEPVVQHGPFVMNTQEEIYATFNEFQQTQFGGWPWPSHDPVHARERGRFAKYPDGKVEVKEN